MAEQQKKIIAGLCATLDSKQNVLDALCGEVELLQEQLEVAKKKEKHYADLHINDMDLYSKVSTEKIGLQADLTRLREENKKLKGTCLCMDCGKTLKTVEQSKHKCTNDNQLLTPKPACKKITGRLKVTPEAKKALAEERREDFAKHAGKDDTLAAILSHPDEDIWDDKPACKVCNGTGKEKTTSDMGVTLYSCIKPCPACGGEDGGG
ncbi:hypothetical protein LCGC14_1083830 [marine sediment metagenome]|uniref:Uncharacterized protein n=1 Tax=marine sediment metagenome TaxID=412755 RepID=A0A0F9N240_9ZZZZ